MNLGAPSGFALHVNGSERARIDSSGRLGIGSSVPGTSLGVALPSTSATIGNIRISPSTAGQARYHLFNGGAVAEWLFGQKTSTDHKFKISKSVAGNETDVFTIDTSGNVGIGTSSPTTLLDVNADTIRVRTARTPASASATGATGEICWDANYIYVCTATNTWKRTAISTW